MCCDERASRAIDRLSEHSLSVRAPGRHPQRESQRAPTCSHCTERVCVCVCVVCGVVLCGWCCVCCVCVCVCVWCVCVCGCV